MRCWSILCIVLLFGSVIAEETTTEGGNVAAKEDTSGICEKAVERAETVGGKDWRVESRLGSVTSKKNSTDVKIFRYSDSLTPNDHLFATLSSQFKTDVIHVIWNQSENNNLSLVERCEVAGFGSHLDNDTALLDCSIEYHTTTSVLSAFVLRGDRKDEPKQCFSGTNDVILAWDSFIADPNATEIISLIDASQKAENTMKHGNMVDARGAGNKRRHREYEQISSLVKEISAKLYSRRPDLLLIQDGWVGSSCFLLGVIFFTSAMYCIVRRIHTQVENYDYKLKQTTLSSAPTKKPKVKAAKKEVKEGTSRESSTVSCSAVGTQIM